MLAPPPGSWHPLLREILDPPLSVWHFWSLIELPYWFKASFTACPKLGQGNIFRSVCQEFCSWGSCPCPHQGWGWGVWPGRSPGPYRGGFQAHTQGGYRPRPVGGVSQHALREIPPPPPADSYYCGQYASYWNAFLFTSLFGEFFPQDTQ